MAEMLSLETSQFLRFQLAGENYAFDVLKAKEVLFLVKITPLPTSLDFLAGVINLRGSVIPIIDLCKKFRLAASPPTEDSAIIVVDVHSNGENSVVGALVDGVKGVMHCDPSMLETPPRFGMQMKSNLIKAIAKQGDQFVVILNADQVFSEKELWLVHEGLSGLSNSTGLHEGSSEDQAKEKEHEESKRSQS